MPFLPMKYPEYRLSMEAALPSSVHSWLRQELEQRGVDSLVYTRYIISLLLQEDEDLDGLEKELDPFSGKKKSRRVSEKTKQRLSVSEEERKKYAAIQCLAQVTDEKSGIEALVDELCSRLKDSEIQAAVCPNVKSRSCSCSDDSSTENQNPAQRYYAAFPALHGQGASKNASPSETIWRNNPIVNKVSSLMSEDDSSSANEDAEIRKINIPNTVVVPRHRKPRKNTSRNRRDHPNPSRNKRDKSRGNQKGKQSQKEHQKPLEFQSWPPGFAKLDPVILQNLEVLDEDLIFVEDVPTKRPNDELCIRVESLLKGMLLPAPEKTYKDLLDVDVVSPEQLREKAKKKSDTVTLSKDVKVCKDAGGSFQEDAKHCDSNSSSPGLRDEAVSPELKEQEIWYTQPIDVVFQSQEDDEVSNSKLRLYKRNSYPSFSSDTGLEEAVSCFESSASSPVFERKRSVSIGSDQSDDIFEGSVLIPAWLTEVISADENSDDNGEDIDLSASLKSSSPFPSSVKSDAPICLIGDEAKEKYGSAWTDTDVQHPAVESADGFLKSQHQQQDDGNTPTPEDGKESSVLPGHLRVDSVSLVDLDYMARFLDEVSQQWQSFSPKGSFALSSQRRPGISTLWQSQVLFDYTLFMSDSLTDSFQPVLELYDLQCWHPIGSSPYSQLWDVNMQKRPKVSPWGGSLLQSENSVWLAENTLVFMHASDVAKDECPNDHSENTLIPQISIHVVSEAETEATTFREQDVDVNSVPGAYQYFDRSVSMGDVPSLWDEEPTEKGNPQLSKSFELVPSEHSAFYDVPRKLLHVHSEPNLVQYRQDFNDSNQEMSQSPQEHLYFSPKTHFRPITPAYAPELFTPKCKQQVCHDLFGGLPSTKTPYQQYHSLECGNEDESFIPSFKVKNYSKSIQTGESVDKSESAEESDESQERDTPETLTLSILEDIINEKDEKMIAGADDLDAANTDSAYETDYGGNAGETEQVSCTPGCVKNEAMYQLQGYSDCDSVDHGHLGEIVDFSVESFLATFPHTQDWPDGAASQMMPHSENTWKDATDDEYPMDGWCPFEPSNHTEENSQAPPPFPVHGQGMWAEELALDMDKYRNIWSTAGHEYYSVDLGAHETRGHGFVDYNEEVYDNVPPDDLIYSSMYPDQEKAEDGNGDLDLGQMPMKKLTDSGVDVHGLEESGFHGYAGFPDNADAVEGEAESHTECGNYFSVKLVYKDKQNKDGKAKDPKHRSYGSYDLMPMPDEAVTSAELEKEWMDVGALWAARKPSSAQRKPCSFYLEGNCRRSDCKFAHDISNITCRFWEEGGCFKGPLCPFLHGYPRECSPLVMSDSVIPEPTEKFDLNSEEFPELSLAVKNGNNNNHKKSKVLKTQNQISASKKDKGRRGNGRRHSNKENRCEVKIIDKCSSSI